ncbi:MAG: aromatic-ring-hydroxylating dioxygenase subunit beta [Deltaproteobacteria bacterium]|nr:aromatic-ring-hydroxylating dioxygenase subunit beta [Deltaproteobacteria bacterium]
MNAREIRDAVEELQYAYVHCIDDDRLEEWPEFFTEHCLYKVVPRENADQNLPIALMYCDSRGMLQDRVVAHRAANLYAPHYYRHMVSAIRIVGRDPAEISAQTNYTVFRTMADPIHYGETELYSTGKYLDMIVFEDSQARFREKVVIADTCKIQSLLVTPL